MWRGRWSVAIVAILILVITIIITFEQVYVAMIVTMGGFLLGIAMLFFPTIIATPISWCLRHKRGTSESGGQANSAVAYGGQGKKYHTSAKRIVERLNLFGAIMTFGISLFLMIVAVTTYAQSLFGQFLSYIPVTAPHIDSVDGPNAHVFSVFFISILIALPPIFVLRWYRHF